MVRLRGLSQGAGKPPATSLDRDGELKIPNAREDQAFLTTVVDSCLQEV